ncbi:MAG: DUF2207 domain-containing protein [Nitrospirae bacterium]|nr:DUF2207 domain-containing protein [Nitrospirota bacterium]
MFHLRYLCAALPAAMMLLWPLSAGAEVIQRFAVDIVLHPDASYTVTETIDYDFEQNRKRGIYRDIPVQYDRQGSAYLLRLQVLGVTDDQGRQRPYELSQVGDDLRIRIGDPKVYITGVHRYVITYHVRRGINYFDGHDELYWNVTGNRWQVPIREASAGVHLPAGTPTEKVQATSYTGYYGDRGKDAKEHREGSRITWQVNRPLKPGEGLTIVVGLPKGVLAPPSQIETATDALLDNLPLGLPLLTLLILGTLWWKRGRNPGPIPSVTAWYEPPEGLSPAEVGTLMDERADPRDVVPTIVDLAVRGYLRIEETARERLLFFTKKDYRLVRADKPPDFSALKPYEMKIFNELFPGSRKEVLVSDLREKFYTTIEIVRETLYERLTKEGYFYGNPRTIRTTYLVAGFIAVFLVGLVLFFISAFRWASGRTVPLLFLSLGVSAVFVYLFARSMPRMTRKGVETVAKILGHREFIERVHKDQIKRLLDKQPDLFGRVLPFAMVFGLAGRWAEAFEGLTIPPPAWYSGPSVHSGQWSVSDFTSDLGSSVHTMEQAFVSRPSSGGSGGSGFGGGGGSGGGSGGGGGGSW